MMGAHHAACGAAAWIALTTQVHVDLTLLAEKVPFLPQSMDIGMGLMDVRPVGVIIGGPPSLYRSVGNGAAIPVW
jgi:hypothetical protein